MNAPQILSVATWVALPTVMYGGYALLTLGDLDATQRTNFRAGHAHAGVLLVLALVFYVSVERTPFPDALKAAMGIALMLAILAQSGGFFIALAPKFAPLGRIVTTVGAVVLACDCLALAYGVART